MSRNTRMPRTSAARSPTTPTCSHVRGRDVRASPGVSSTTSSRGPSRMLPAAPASSCTERLCASTPEFSPATTISRASIERSWASPVPGALADT